MHKESIYDKMTNAEKEAFKNSAAAVQKVVDEVDAMKK